MSTTTKNAHRKPGDLKSKSGMSNHREVRSRNGGRKTEMNKSSSSSSSQQWPSDVRERYSSTELLDITSLSEIGGADIDANVMNRKIKNLLANLPEDLRISKLLRQLSSEKDSIEARKICVKLNIVVLDSANVGYMRRSFDVLADTFMRIFKDCPGAAATDVADVFGKMGWMIRSDLTIYRTWIARMYKQERNRDYALRALLHTLQMDASTREIRSDQCNRIIEMLKEQLETVEKPTHFIAITKVIQQFAHNYPKQFDDHFADIVDILIGWHLETDQLLSVKQHCSMVLQSFKSFWLSDVTFTQNLLNQFLEDVINIRDDMMKKGEHKNVDGRDSSTPEICFGSIVGATNSILKCIYDSAAVLCQHIGIELLNDIVRSVLEMIQAFELHEMESGRYSNEQCDIIYMYVNELIVIALDCRKIGVEISEELLLSTILHQLATLNVEIMPAQKILTFLFVVYKILGELKTNISSIFLQKIVGTDSNLRMLKFAHNPKITKAYVRIYQTILESKNVELLQETYRFIIYDLTNAIDSLTAYSESCDTSHVIYTKAQAELIVCFHLATISTLATATSSIIVMWVLEPNLLELLTDRLESHSALPFWCNSPETHHAIITLLISHCRNNNNFITSSQLVNQEITKITDVFNKLAVDDAGSNNFSNEFIPGASSFIVPATKKASVSDSSPTANHFELILKFLCRLLGNQLNRETTLLLLDWCECIIGQASAYAGVLVTNSQFFAILEAINRIASESPASKEIQLKVADCFGVLLGYELLNPDLLEWIAETCCIKMCASDSMIRNRYSQLFARLPLNVSLKQVHQFTGTAKGKQQQINSAQHWYLRTPTQQRGIEMRSQFFTDFIRAINIREKPTTNKADSATTDHYHQVESIFRNIFMYAHGHETKARTNEMAEFDNAIWSDIRVLMFWVQCEAAQSCVNNKLRTALGKPQETFMKIEAMIKDIARLLAIKEKSTLQNIDTILATQRHARILLGFMECLEKYICNASDGMAVALPAMEKPVRTFFRVNATTCNEWFNRIRPAVDIVGSHCMEPEMVVRYTESVLKNLVANGKVADPLFEQTLITHALALLRNKESDALLGLFEWTKCVAKKKFQWIKLVAGEQNGFYLRKGILFVFLFKECQF